MRDENLVNQTISTEKAIRLLKAIFEREPIEFECCVPEQSDKFRTVEIDEVIFHDPATIIRWTDGTKTVVKCDGEKFDQEKGLAMAIVKKMLGNKGNYYDLFRNYCDEEYVREGSRD